MSHGTKKIKKERSCSGKVLIELILVTPILLMIPAGVMEYARFLRMDQIATVYSQEAANRAYRQCGDFYVNVAAGTNTWSSQFGTEETSAATLQCITNVMNATNASMQSYLPGSQIIISVYRYNFNVNLTTPTNTVTLVAVIPNQTSPDMFSKTLVGIGGSQNSLERMSPRSGILLSAAELQARQRVVVAEVAFNYLPVLSIFRAFLNATNLTMNGEFRETTIL
jgi:hypothetical protein